MTGYGKSVLQLPTKKISIELKSLNSKSLDLNARMPSMYRATERDEIDEEEWDAISTEINDAITKIVAYRKDEGATLEQDFTNRIANLRRLLEEVITMDPDRIDGVRARLEKGVSDIKEKVDENRFEQELVYYIEKFDITEEKVRLDNHLDYFTKTLNSDDSNGKKLGFITQEIGREINTIGSKSNYAPMQKLVVQMKDELEKIKEQLLNVL